MLLRKSRIIEAYSNTFENFRHCNFQKILVKPNTAGTNSAYYVSEIKKLQNKKTKERGIEFIIINENSYDDFISFLNDCHISKHDRYGLDNTEHFFVLVDYKDPNEK